MPARALKSVVLPVLGLPKRAIVRRGQVCRVGGWPVFPEGEGLGRVKEGWLWTSSFTLSHRHSVDPLFERGEDYTGGLGEPQAEAIIAKADLHGVAERGETKDLEFLTFEQTHLKKALDQAVVAPDALHSGSLADP